MDPFFEDSSCHFKEVSCGIVGEFGISQKDTKDVLRNKWGKSWKKSWESNLFSTRMKFSVNSGYMSRII